MNFKLFAVFAIMISIYLILSIMTVVITDELDATSMFKVNLFSTIISASIGIILSISV